MAPPRGGAFSTLPVPRAVHAHHLVAEDTRVVRVARTRHARRGRLAKVRAAPLDPAIDLTLDLAPAAPARREALPPRRAPRGTVGG